MMSGLIDSRKTCVIGISLILGLSVDMLPEAYRGAYPALQPFFSSSLSLATVSVILLTFCCASRIGKRAELELQPGVDSSEQIFNFMEAMGQRGEHRVR